MQNAYHTITSIFEKSCAFVYKVLYKHTHKQQTNKYKDNFQNIIMGRYDLIKKVKKMQFS